MRHLLGLARNAFPYLDAIRTIKGLEPLKGRDWVTLARETPGNPSFILLVAELVQRLEQGTGHMDIVSPWTVSGPKELELLCRRYQTTERSIRLQKPWWDLLRRGARRTHAAFRVAYRGGEYVLTEGYRSGDHHLPPATAIAAVDGLEVHDYVKTLFGQRWLRYDADRRRLYAPGGSPFEVPGARDATSWRVRFRIDEEQEVTLDIPKRTREKTRPSKKPPNAVCLRLTDDVGYVRVASFLGYDDRVDELKRIADFLDRGEQTFSKLIIDVRRNGGGAPTYWEQAFVRRLLRSEATLTAYSAMRRRLYDRMRDRFDLLKAELQRDERASFVPGRVTRVRLADLPFRPKPDLFDDESWTFFRTKKTYTPTSSGYGAKVYLLVDNDCFSATEDFARAVKQLGLGRVIGSRTGGGAASTIAPWVFELPNSHIMLSMQIEASFNSDGALNDPYATKPDVELARSTYPTPFPRRFDREHVLADPWVRWVLQRQRP